MALSRKHAFILALLLTGLIFSNVHLIKNLSKERETVFVSRVIDGDTLELKDGRTLRLANINSPEKSDLNYLPALNYLKDLENKSVEIEVISKDKYYRELARIYYKGYINLNLVSQGLANKYLVQTDELSPFYSAEKSAIENSLGIWNKSPNFNCLSSDINEEDEIISLTNSCPNLILKNLKIKDEGRKLYPLPEISGKLTIYSGIGNNNNTSIFLNSKTNIWNNDRDTLYIFDEEGNLVHYHSYGY